MTTVGATAPSVGDLMSLIDQAAEIYHSAIVGGVDENVVLPDGLGKLFLTAQELLASELGLDSHEVIYGDLPDTVLTLPLPQVLVGAFWGICFSLAEFGHGKTSRDYIYPECEELVDFARAYAVHNLLPRLSELGLLRGLASVEGAIFPGCGPSITYTGQAH